MDKEFEEIKNKMNITELYIKRVPRNDRKWFIDYANQEYEGDYGMLLKELISFYRGMLTETVLTGMVDMNNKIDELLRRTEQPQKEEEDTAKYKIMADGTKRRIE